MPPAEPPSHASRLLVFPLRAGTMALAALIAAYSIAGGIVLFMYGDFLWFLYPEVPIYGGISMAIGACSILLLLAFANRSRHEAKVIWECQNGGQLYNETLINDPTYNAASYDGDKIPSQFCSSGWNSLYLAFTFGLAIDCVLQLYQCFLVWRFRAFLRQYMSYKASATTPGYYYA
ncbi:hypothetical protein Rhopal_002651-T1 [Rhodotorula paludigena]|uniref:Uncharacterized protein n=1 Tax=Rhodotorula paludigena TaxID=86838 RepID=A0AAV5GGG3_9BASI|nr:hypothetical protein Rhopal_002651-T1 [Rhodotorula paludigena]